MRLYLSLVYTSRTSKLFLQCDSKKSCIHPGPVTISFSATLRISACLGFETDAGAKNVIEGWDVEKRIYLLSNTFRKINRGYSLSLHSKSEFNPFLYLVACGGTADRIVGLREHSLKHNKRNGY